MADRTPSQRSRSAISHDPPARLPSNIQATPVSSKLRSPVAPSSTASSTSPRRTRSSARKATSETATSGTASNDPLSIATTTTDTSPSTAAKTSAEPVTGRKRRRSSTVQKANRSPPSNDKASTSPSRRSKRSKTSDSVSEASSTAVPPPLTRSKKAQAPLDMSSPENSAKFSSAMDQSAQAGSASSSRKSSRSKRGAHSTGPTGSTSASSLRSKDAASSHVESGDTDTAMTGTEDPGREAEPSQPPENPETQHPEDDSDNDDDEEEEDNDSHRHYDDDDDPFGGFGAGGPGGLTSTLRALTGMMSGISSRLREILNNLRQKGDPSIQLIALQELSEILLVSNEDNLSGHFSPDSFVKELVTLMQPNEFTGEENPEIMLLACRSLANLMEAIPASTANVVYGGAVPVLCQKLLEIQFIDLAEQALSTLEKISVEYPTSIVREGGLTACLSYLDFFATSTQRTAVTTAANCCRNIPEDSFPVIRDVMPILLNVLGSNDQRVVEQASLCVTRIIESFKYQSSKLEELVSVDLLRAVLRLLVPGTTNLISANIHTQFLRVLAITARSSPRLSAELFKLNVVETLYQILTGVSPPSETDDVASKLDSVVIMQALIHRPREQIIETLNVICELLPGIRLRDTDQHGVAATDAPPSASRKKSSAEKRLELLNGCKDEVRRFAMILFPTLTDAFSSTVNLSVRQKVLTAQLKMLSNLDKDILIGALKSVPYASFLASILSQQDHPSLVIAAIQSTELLLSRLNDIYRYQIYREGVIAEVAKLAADYKEPVSQPAAETSQEPDTDQNMDSADETEDSRANGTKGDSDDEDQDQDEDDDQDDDEDDDDNAEDDQRTGHNGDDGSGSPVSSDGSTMSIDGPSQLFTADVPSMKSKIAEAAKRFLDAHETEQQGKVMKDKAQKILENLRQLASQVEAFYLHRTADSLAPEQGFALFEQLSSYFDADMLESVTSAELLASGLVRVLEEVFSNPDEALANSARAAFLEVFMGRSVRIRPKTTTAESPATPFSVLVHKLQDLLSRSEHFEVLTVHQNTFDGNRSSAASMLAKQIRLRLVADDESDIPRSYRNIMVSIHAIATFKALDDYLRPRINLYERPRIARPRDGLSRALAAMASSAGLASTGRLAERLAAAEAASPLATLAGATPSGSSYAERHLQQKKTTSASSASNAAESGREKAVLRRSSRRNQAASSESPIQPPAGPNDDDDDLRNALECADEREISDDEIEDDTELADASALDALVGNLDEDLEDAPDADPSAVSVEVAAGGKVEARKEDGTRVPTPAQVGATKPPGRAPAGTSSSLQHEQQAGGQQTPTPSTSSRPLSYAAAIQSVPSDWHIEFSLDGKVIPNETTIYRAVHKNSTASDDYASRSAWSAVHSIKFRRVPGPPPAEPIGFAFSTESTIDANGIPPSLAHHPTTASILRLLNILHDVNSNIDDVLVENKAALKLNVEPLAQFVNTKLTAKLNRQLEEPLIVASNCLPNWSEDMARLYPFLFPFETRHLFLQSTSFGYARSMSRWQNAQQEETSRRDRRDDRPFLGRLQRQKVRISRSKILESALKVMELYGASQSILEVEYFEEVGTGLGPTLEFYSTVSREFSKKKLKLFRDTDTNESEEFAVGPNGLFPRPMNEENPVIIHLFKMLGKFVARSMIDSRIIDINFNPVFFRIGEETAGIKPSLNAIKVVDPALANSLKLVKKFVSAKKAIDEDPNRTAAQKVADTDKILVDNVSLDDLALDFTLPGYPEIELIPGGSSETVTIYNVESYLDKVIDMTLGSGVKPQVEAFRAGFSQVFPYSALSAFTPEELVALFGRVEEDWSLETLMDSIKADHGFNMDSKSVRNLLQTMSEYTPAQRRDFLQFTTGSPKLPIGGFRNLTPMFTVVCKPSEPPYTSDDYLPSVMTCVNYLKLPDYSSINIMKKQLLTATREGQGAFHLS